MDNNFKINNDIDYYNSIFLFYIILILIGDLTV